MKARKQSMRELRDAAAHDRAVSIIKNIGSIALAEAARRTQVPGNKPQYFRGALVKPQS